MTASAPRPNRNASRRLWSSRKRRSPGVRMRWSGGKPSWTPPAPCRRRRKAGRSPCRRHRDADGRAGTHRRGRRRLPCTAAEPRRASERQADGAAGPSEGRRTGPQPDRSAGKTGQRCREPPRRAGREPHGPRRPQRGLSGRDRGHPPGQDRQHRAHRGKRGRDTRGHREAPALPEGRDGGSCKRPRRRR